jgi:hypothetical protein
MYLDAPFIDIGEWSELWNRVIKSNDENHKKNGVDIKLVTRGRESKLVASYLGKYVAKIDKRDIKNIPNKPGRMWGKWNIEDPIPTEIELFDYQAEQITDHIIKTRREKNWEPLDYSICTIMGESMGTNEFEKNVIKMVKEIVSRGTNT